MLKNALIFVAVVAGVSLLALSFLTARYIDHQELLRVTTEKTVMLKERADLEKTIASLNARQTDLQARIADLTADVSTKQKKIDALETERSAAQLSVRKLSRRKDVEDAFRKTFPEVAGSKWGVTKVHDEENDVDLDYLLVPLFFSKTFIIDHENSLNYEKQRDTLKEVSGLKDQIIGLQGNVLTLEKEKSAAFESGYNRAFTLYTDLNEKYVTLLKKPPVVQFKPPGLTATLGGALLGLALGAKL